MATQAQIDANRLNARNSTGPKTPETKAKSAANAIALGLFSVRNCVRPEELEEYQTFSGTLWSRLSPADPAEDIFAIEAVRFSWRLHRCAKVEASLSEQAGELDPMSHPDTAGTQASVDRARAQALSGLQRCMASLKALQTERTVRAELFQAGFKSERLGLASLNQVMTEISRRIPTGPELAARAASHAPASIQNEPNPQPQPAPAVEAVAAPEAKQTRSAAPPPSPPTPAPRQTPRNALCPCNSGTKFKRCCGRNAPAILGRAA